MADNEESLFGGLTIARSEPLPKRMVAGRTGIPNPFVDAVHDSYRENMDKGPDGAVREIHVPVKASEITQRATVRKNKGGKFIVNIWEQHPNITTAMYLLRQAAGKNQLGVRIVVDTAEEKLEEATVKVDGKDQTFKNVTLHKFTVVGGGANKGRVRVRFLGTKKKDTFKDDSA